MNREEFLQNLPKLLEDYQPDADVKSRLKKITFVALVSPTGMGKTTIIQGTGWPMLISETTREPRPNETQGIDMAFNQDYDQLHEDIKNGRFVQLAIGPTGDLYGTRPEAYSESGTVAGAVVADVIPQFRELGFKQFHLIFLAAPNYTEWQRRLMARGDTAENIKMRMAEANRSLGMSLADPDYTFVLNDQIPQAIEDVRSVIDGKYDMGKHQIAQEAASNILKELNSV